MTGVIEPAGVNVDFTTPEGERRELRDPSGEPTFRQLKWLNRVGRLRVVDEVGEPLTKGQVAWLIDQVLGELGGELGEGSIRGAGELGNGSS